MSNTIESTAGKPCIVLDDGRYHVLLNPLFPSDWAPGFLEVRQRAGSSKCTCVGSFIPRLDGRWTASVNVPYDDTTESDSMLVGHFDRRIDAIVRLWRDRHKAVLPPGY